MPNYTLPAPRTWALNAKIKAPYLRADAADAVALLAAPPMFSGSQQNAGQTSATGANTAMNLDTEQYDNWGGHSTVTNKANYYGMFAGWYLAQFTGAFAYTGGTGVTGAGIGLSTAGGTVVNWTGQTAPNSGTAGQNTTVTGAKLIQMTSVGTAGGASNDYVQGFLTQNSGATQTTQITASFPQLQTWWVAASSGTTPLTVPANAAWPVPPAIITSAFMNANVRDAIGFLIYPPVCEAFYSAGTATLASQATIPATGTTAPLDTTRVDNYAAFNVTTHTWTAPVAGTYWLYNQDCLSGAATRVAQAAGLTITSANYNGGATFTLWGGAQTFGSNTGIAVVRRRLRLNAGDTVIPAAWQNDSGANAATFQNTTAGRESRFIAIWRGA